MARSYFNYEAMLRLRQEWLQKQLTGKLLVKSTDRDFEVSRQGMLKRYVTFEFTQEVASTNWSVFLNDVKEHSGCHKHQGGLVLFVLEGSGVTEIDGTRYAWKRGDLITLPIRPGGIEHQHFNDSREKNCRWVAFYYKPFEDWVCHTMTHIRDYDVAPRESKLTGSFSGGESPAELRLPAFHYQPEAATKQNLFNALLQIRDVQRQLRKATDCILRGEERQWEVNRHGVMRWYLHPLIFYTALHNFSAYLQFIPPGSRSGLQKHPGDMVFFTLQGKGHTMVDGVRYDWGVEDLLILPIRPDGVSFQHFNDDPDKAAFLFACEPNIAFVFDLDRGSSLEELEDAPEFSRQGPADLVTAKVPAF
ncbi:MAG TPA: cupin domain-containing protein [Terriglobales bacterium]|nr:cupin domain-containing protein [Terriglobales bacterium]